MCTHSDLLPDRPASLPDALSAAKRAHGHKTQSTAASALGIPQQTFGRWLKGARPKDLYLPSIAQYLGVSIETLERWYQEWWAGKQRSPGPRATPVPTPIRLLPGPQQGVALSGPANRTDRLPGLRIDFASGVIHALATDKVVDWGVLRAIAREIGMDLTELHLPTPKGEEPPACLDSG